jgi:CubicO group peptidase (beta-lactamase class C family)
MEALDDILERYSVTDPSLDTDGKLLGVSFVVLRNQGLFPQQSETEEILTLYRSPEIVYSSSRGQRSLEPTARPWTADTFTWIASMTKLITSTCLMQLVEAGKIGLDDDVRSLVPQLKAMQVLEGFDDAGKPLLRDNRDPITLR